MIIDAEEQASTQFMGPVAGAVKIIAVDVNEYKLSEAKKFGATDVIDPTQENLEKRVRDLQRAMVLVSPSTPWAEGKPWKRLTGSQIIIMVEQFYAVFLIRLI